MIDWFALHPILTYDLGSLSAETSALLLASKSNYQNIIEGTHLPGVLYPEALSENLTSKRTSHKIAEQGRRNRINGALQEIAALLPSASPMKPEGGSSSQTSQNNSKANTVEQAIDFIKALQKRIQELEGKLEAAEAKIGMQSESGADGEAKSRGEAGVTEEEKAGAE